MVRYVILRRFLHKVPPKRSFQNTGISAWLTPRRGHLWGVKFTDSNIWKPVSNNNQSLDDNAHTMSDDDNRNLERTTGTIGRTEMPTTKTMIRLTMTAKSPNQLSETNIVVWGVLRFACVKMNIRLIYPTNFGYNIYRNTQESTR